MLAGIRDILIITTPADQTAFSRLLGDGSDFGINLSYEIQYKPEGIAQAFIIGEEFINSESVCLVLGDNLFYGHGFVSELKKAASKKEKATIFGYQVRDPERFGIVEFDCNQNVLSIEEKPIKPRSAYAVTGLYFYDQEVVKIAKEVEPSNRGELEITSVNQIYLKKNKLDVELLGRGFAWLDTGTPESLLEASSFVETIEHRQGTKIACLEEIALNCGWISESHIREKIKSIGNTPYAKYLEKLLVESM